MGTGLLSLKTASLPISVSVTTLHDDRDRPNTTNVVLKREPIKCPIHCAKAFLVQL